MARRKIKEAEGLKGKKKKFRKTIKEKESLYQD